MQHHHNIPQVFVNVGKRCPDGLKPPLFYQGRTSLRSSLNALASCVGLSEVQVGPDSSNPDFGPPCLLLRYPPLLY